MYFYIFDNNKKRVFMGNNEHKPIFDDAAIEFLDASSKNHTNAKALEFGKIKRIQTNW